MCAGACSALLSSQKGHSRLGSAETLAEAVEHHAPLDLLDGLGDLDAPGAGLGAVEGGPAPEHPGLLAQDLEALPSALVAGVEDEAVSVDDGRRSHVSLVTPEDGARGRARRAQDALRGVVEALALLRRLAP